MSKINLTKHEAKIIFLSALGGGLEFYDFVIFVFLASELSQLFFPASNALASLLGIYGIFAVGYLVRPLGGLIFSHFGDRYGRKTTFVVTLILMALPTFMIGLLPTYQSFGIWAPIALITLRLIQGLSVGGEIPGAITFAGEHVAAQYRGLSCGIIFFGINFGLVLGSGLSALLTMALSAEQILNGGWRLPFLFGGLLGFLSFALRKQLTETPLFHTNKKRAVVKFPIWEIVTKFRLQLFQGVALTWLDAVIVCLLFLYLPNYLTTVLNYPKETINLLNTLALILTSVVFVLLAYLSDRYGRKLFLILGSLSFVIFSYGFFYLLAQQQLMYAILVMMAFALLSACITGIYTCAIIELFPTSVRYTGMAISYNIGFALFGGFTPLIATSLIHYTGNILAPSFYLILSSVIALIAALTLKNSHNKALLE